MAICWPLATITASASQQSSSHNSCRAAAEQYARIGNDLNTVDIRTLYRCADAELRLRISRGMRYVPPAFRNRPDYERVCPSIARNFAVDAASMEISEIAFFRTCLAEVLRNLKGVEGL